MGLREDENQHAVNAATVLADVKGRGMIEIGGMIQQCDAANILVGYPTEL
jgi:hypothetical protein